MFLRVSIYCFHGLNFCVAILDVWRTVYRLVARCICTGIEEDKVFISIALLFRGQIPYFFLLRYA